MYDKHLSIAHLIRSFSEILAYSESTDPVYQKIVKKDKGGFPVLTTLIDTRITGWKSQGQRDVVESLQAIKTQIDGGHWDAAQKAYETDVIPAIKKHYGPK